MPRSGMKPPDPPPPRVLVDVPKLTPNKLAAKHIPTDETVQDPIDLSDVAAISLPPEALESDPSELAGEDDAILQWDARLDQTDYFALLRLDPASTDTLPTDRDVKDAFHAFALAFHPDRYRSATESVQGAVHRIYCRGAEAYRVLQDPLLRKRYARQLSSGVVRMKADEIAQSTRLAPGDAPEKIEDIVKSAAARVFAVRADELMAIGDLKQARLQLSLAQMREPQNARLQELMRELDEAIARKPSLETRRPP